MRLGEGFGRTGREKLGAAGEGLAMMDLEMMDSYFDLSRANSSSFFRSSVILSTSARGQRGEQRGRVCVYEPNRSSKHTASFRAITCSNLTVSSSTVGAGGDEESGSIVVDAIEGGGRRYGEEGRWFEREERERV